MSVAEVSPPLELDPPRTWRGWWLAWPKWFRIGGYAFAGLAVLHVALAVRICVGLQEPAEIKALRQRGVRIHYAWEFMRNSNQQKRLQLWDTLMAGLYGKSWRNVVEIDSSHLTDEDLRFFGQECSSLIRLSLPGAKITVQGLQELARCRRLGLLDLSQTDIDDTAGPALSQMKSLANLNLSETLVSDIILSYLEKMPRLRKVDVVFTDVTAAAAQEWKTTHHRPLSILNARDGETDTLGSIRWRDGARSAGIPANVNFRTTHSRPRSGTRLRTSASGMTRRDLYWRLRSEGDGEHSLILKIGDFKSAPAIVTMKNGKPSTPTFEVCMPCTKAEALDSVQPSTE